MSKLITTSWDDGHVLDFKLAALLQKYNLPGTFYIPQSNPERAVMLPRQVQALAADFEIGGHTLNHTRLYTKNGPTLQKEIRGSYLWLQDLLGEPPASFCFPGGVYNRTSAAAVFECGYRVARTTELFSVKPFVKGTVLPTTLQVYPHSKATYAKHLGKRRKWATLLHWLKHHPEKDLVTLTNYHLERVSQNGGCFHLWGHSWEIEAHGLWGQLELLFQAIAARPGFTYTANRGLAEN